MADFPLAGPPEPDGQAEPPARWTQVGRHPATLVVLGVVLGVIAAAIFFHAAGSPASAVASGASTAAPSAAPSVGVVPIPPASGPAGAGLLHVRPTAVRIPALGVHSNLLQLGLNGDGSLQVPTDYTKAGWYDQGPYPGDANSPPALIVGHVDSDHGPAIFYRLSELQVGDKAFVKRADGSTATFVVYRTGSFSKARYPASSIYASSQRPELRLITCTGQFDQQSGYLSNFVAFLTLKSSKGPR